MKHSRTITYAIHAMLCLASVDAGVPIPCSRLARDGRMPERFLLQIMRILVNQALLHSTRGVDGGYILARDPENISLVEIVEAFDNPLEPHLPDIDGLLVAVRVRLLETLEKTSRAARRELEQLTLADLLNGPDAARDLAKNREPDGGTLQPRARCK